MARELGLNPEKLGKINNHKQEPWKAPLPEFIEEIYFKHFKKTQPGNIRSLKQILEGEKKKKEEKKRKKRKKRKERKYSLINPGNCLGRSFVLPKLDFLCR